MSEIPEFEADRGPKRFQIIIGVVFGIIGLICVAFCLFRWDRKQRREAKRLMGIQMGMVSSQRERREQRQTNRYDGLQNDTTLPAYSQRQADEVPSLFNLSSLIASLKASEGELTTSPYHLIFFERISQLQTMIKDIRSLLEAAPPEGYEPQSEEAQEIENLKKQMLELVGPPEQGTEANSSNLHGAPEPSGRSTPAIAAASAAEAASPRPNEDALRHQGLTRIHTLLTPLTLPTSDSTLQYNSTFDELTTSIEALMHSIKSVPIPQAETEGRNEPNSSSSGAHPPQSTSPREVQLPTYQ